MLTPDRRIPSTDPQSSAPSILNPPTLHPATASDSARQLQRQLDWKGAFGASSGVPAGVLLTIAGIATMIGQPSWVVWIASILMGGHAAQRPACSLAHYPRLCVPSLYTGWRPVSAGRERGRPIPQAGECYPARGRASLSTSPRLRRGRVDSSPLRGSSVSDSVPAWVLAGHPRTIPRGSCRVMRKGLRQSGQCTAEGEAGVRSRPLDSRISFATWPGGCLNRCTMIDCV